MAYVEDIDIKSVKKGKFGPLDVYPQEEKQKEVRFQLIKKREKIFKIKN
jgi:hypothetical protein